MRTPRFRTEQHDLIAGAIREMLIHAPRQMKFKSEAMNEVMRKQIIEDASLVIDALGGLFIADNPHFDWRKFQRDIGVDIGPVSNKAMHRARLMMQIKEIGND